MSYIVSVLSLMSVLLMAVMGTFLVTGLTGLFSMGQGAFLAIGAYSSAILVTRAELPFFLSALLAVAIAATIAAVIGFVALRMTQDYFALVTFGFGEALVAILNVAVGLTGGSVGFVGIPQDATPALILVSAVLTAVLAAGLKSTNFGRTSMAIRDNELAAEVLGIPVFYHKFKVFVLGAAITSFAGVLYGSYLTVIDPNMFGWMRSAEWIIIVYFGGRNSLSGAILSGLCLLSLPEILRFAAEWRVIIYCVLILITISFRPQGIMGNLELTPKGIRRSLKNLRSSLGRGKDRAGERA